MHLSKPLLIADSTCSHFIGTQLGFGFVLKRIKAPPWTSTTQARVWSLEPADGMCGCDKMWSILIQKKMKLGPPNGRFPRS